MMELSKTRDTSWLSIGSELGMLTCDHCPRDKVTQESRLEWQEPVVLEQVQVDGQALDRAGVR